ncbi:carbonic anhydrase [Mucilaginibacter sp.]|uniref:carbonic anhydrase n=1 Tax=Mucilaginibacter sp. TaxID=1882438 RepID=UPI003B006C1D
MNEIVLTYGIIYSWLRHIKDIYRLHAFELDLISDEKERANRLVEYNVMEGVNNLCKTSIIQNAWENNKTLSVHGWVYELSTGFITDLKVSTTSSNNMNDVFKFDF